MIKVIKKQVFVILSAAKDLLVDSSASAKQSSFGIGLRMTIGIGLAVFFLAGCGQKKEVPKSAVITEAAAPAELPELAQNKIFETNRTETLPPPDYSFQALAEEQQTAPPPADGAPPQD